MLIRLSSVCSCTNSSSEMSPFWSIDFSLFRWNELICRPQWISFWNWLNNIFWHFCSKMLYTLSVLRYCLLNCFSVVCYYLLLICNVSNNSKASDVVLNMILWVAVWRVSGPRRNVRGNRTHLPLKRPFTFPFVSHFSSRRNCAIWL